MIFKQLAHLPIIFKVDENILDQIGAILRQHNLSFGSILVLSGSSFSEQISQRLIANFDKRECKHEVVQNNSTQEVQRLRNIIQSHRFDLLIAVGGGKVLDTVKRLSLLTSINHLSIPTIISNDGLISPIAVLTNEQGKTESLPATMPMGVIIDLDVVNRAPIKFMRAAAGDILSNISATHDWVIANKKQREPINDIAYELSRSSASGLINFSDTNFQNKAFIRQIIYGQVNSGLAMSLAGTSRPCSGSEHLLSHAIDHLGYSEDLLHGIQVGTLSLFCLFLQKKLKKVHLEYAKKTDIPLLPNDLNAKIENQLSEIFELGKSIRVGRYTILDEISNEEFLDEYEKYRSHISSSI
ncbi:MAG: iron-containing alcohol dehydrogenase [Reichenbachiella sp.]|uniref:iron-containing alcohol dehydrogenase n=2 Tax=Reichenbachiella sp. TaxID=2184521 RepID=UPI003267BEAA